MLTRKFSAFLFFTLVAIISLLVIGCNSGDDDDSDSASDITDDDTQTDDDDASGDRLYAGAASASLDLPIGIAMGGFAVRIGLIMPYNKLMGGSFGYLDRPDVKAVALRRNGLTLVIARVVMMGVTESLRTQVVNLVREQTGLDLDRSLILNATHTHSGPGHFLPVPDITGLVGVDVYNQKIVDRIAGSIAGTIVEAIESMEPARIGFGYRESFDPDERLVEDRRCYNGPGVFKEDRLWIGRIENDEGETFAMLVGMAMHGVIYSYGMFDLTGDAPGGVERAVEKLYDYPVTVLYIQGSAGDVVPLIGGSLGHGSMQMTEWIGSQVAQIVKEIDEDVITDDQPELKVLTRRYTTDRQTLGYEPGEFGYYDYAGEFIEYEKGAMECGVLANEAQGSIADCDNPETMLVDGYLGCMVDLSWPQVAVAADLFTQSPLTVARIGDHYFFTAPGEITSHLAVDTRRQMAETLGVPFENINTIGYAQNYIFYILQDWDWMQGGGETEGSFFGWRYGPWLQNEVSRMALWMEESNPPPDDDPPPNLFYKETEAVQPELSERLGEVAVEAKAESQRFEIVRFTWYGGHPEIDRRRVVLQQKVDGEYVDVKRSNGSIYDDEGWEIAVRLFPVPSYREERNLESRLFEYRIAWETSFDDPIGLLRFKVIGVGRTSQGEISYELASEPFRLSPAQNIMVYDISATQSGGSLTIEATAAYPPDPWMARRMRSPLSGGNNPAIIPGGSAVATIEDEQGNLAQCALIYDPLTQKLVGELATEGLTGALRVEVASGAVNDGYANTNSEASEPVVTQP